jgi:hypothetical protein
MGVIMTGNRKAFHIHSPSCAKNYIVIGKKPSFPRNLSLYGLSRERESRPLKLLGSTTNWMPASKGMTNYDMTSKGRWSFRMETI